MKHKNKQLQHESIPLHFLILLSVHNRTAIVTRIPTIRSHQSSFSFLWAYLYPKFITYCCTCCAIQCRYEDCATRCWKRTTIRSRNTIKSLKAERVWDIGIVEGMGGWSRVATARRKEIGWGTCSYQGVPTDRRYIEGLLQAVYKAGRNVTANFTQRREFLTIFAATCWR